MHCSSNGPRFLVAWCLVLSVLAATSAAAAQVVRGQVLNAGGEPWPDVAVALIPAGDPYAATLARLAGRALPEATATVRTGSWGEFVLEAPQEGLWQVLVTPPGAVPMLHAAVPVVRDVLLPPVTPVPDEGLEVRTVPGEVGVWLLRPDGGGWDGEALNWHPAPRVGRSDAGGRLRLPLAAGERPEVAAGRLGWQGYHGPAELRNGVFTLELAETKLCRLRLGIRDGDLAKGVILAVDGVVQGLVDEAGWVTLSEGTAALDVLTPEGVSWRLSGGCPGQTATTLLPPPRWVEGRVTDRATGQPLAGALVWDDRGRAVMTDSRGRYRLASTGLEERRIFAEAAGYRAEQQTISEGPVPAVDFPLVPQPDLRGRVQDEAGRPVVDAGIHLEAAWQIVDRWHPQGGDAESATSWYDGSFQLPVPPGFVFGPGWGLRLVVTSPDHAPYEDFLAEIPSRPLVVTMLSGVTLVGEVVDPEDAPVAAAQVGLMTTTPGAEARPETEPDFLAVTNSDGTFSLPHIAPGRFDVLVTARGYAVTTLPALEIPPEVAEVDLGIVVLEPGVAIEGVVRDPAGVPVPGAVIEPEGRGESAASTTDVRGRFRLPDLRRGEVLNLSVQHPGFVPATVPGVEAPTAEPLEITLTVGGRITGRVLDEAGEPVRTAVVVGTRDIPSTDGGYVAWQLRQQTAIPQPDGTFELKNLAAGHWQLEARSDVYLHSEVQRVELAAGGTAGPLEFVLRRGATLIGQILGPRGEVATGAYVHYQLVQSNYTSNIGMAADQAGRFRFEGLAVGPLEVTASHDILGKVQRWVEIRPGENTVELRLEAMAGVSGRVVDPQGGPVAHGEVILRMGNTSIQQGIETDGQFRFRHLDPGLYQVSARGEGFATSQPVPLTLGETSIEGLELRLTPGVELTGTLHGLTLEQLSRATVSAYQTDHSGYQSLAQPPDLDAHYRLLGLSPGRWRVQARVEGGPMEQALLVVEEGERQLQLDFQFEGSGEFRVQVLHNGTPMPQVPVTVHGQEKFASAITNHQGVAKIEGLPDGSYRATVGLSWGSVSEAVEVWDGGEAVIEVRTGRLVGTVRSAADGAPLEGVSLNARFDASQGRADFTSDALGEFDQPLQPGIVQLVASLDGYAVERLQVEILPGGVTPLNLELRPAGTLEIAVRHAAGGVPDTLAFRVLDRGGQILIQRMLQPQGPAGRFRIPALPADSRVVLHADGAAFYTVAADQLQDGASLVLPPGSTLQMEVPALSTEVGGAARLRLVAADGTPFSPAVFGLPLETWPISGGFGQVPGLAVGTWSYQLTAADGRTWEGTFTALPGQTTRLVVE